MNVLDENIGQAQRRELERWRVKCPQIGVEIGWLGMKDQNEIIPLLHTLDHPTFFTRDHDFYHRWLRHAGYCLCYLAVAPNETALFVRRFLRHRSFRTQAQRMGKIVRVHHSGISVLQAGSRGERKTAW